MTVDMKKAFAYSLAKLKVQKIFNKQKKAKQKKAITCMMKFQEFRKPM